MQAVAQSLVALPRHPHYGYITVHCATEGSNEQL